MARVWQPLRVCLTSLGSCMFALRTLQLERYLRPGIYIYYSGSTRSISLILLIVAGVCPDHAASDRRRASNLGAGSPTSTAVQIAAMRPARGRMTPVPAGGIESAEVRCFSKMFPPPFPCS